MSEFLGAHLGEAYAPSIHWTSHLRGRAGHVPYESHHSGCSTFTFADNGDAFTKFLTQWGYGPAASWCKCPVYHIQVVVSEKDLLSSFLLDPIQVKKVKIILYAALHHLRDDVDSFCDGKLSERPKADQ